ncbi:MAG: hypothetical protein ACRYG2_36610 [Janthinobacterium lividum]
MPRTALPTNTNHAVIAYDRGCRPDPASTNELSTVAPRTLTGPNRYVAFRVGYAAINCTNAGTSPPVLQFACLDAAGSPTAIRGTQNACNGSTISGASSRGTFTSAPVLYPGSSLGVRVLNNATTGNGNDGAIDDLQILDVTPQLDVAFSPSTISAGGTSTLTHTVTNTTDLLAKSGFSFTNALPAGLTVVPTANYATTCTGTPTATGNTAGSTSLT